MSNNDLPHHQSNPIDDELIAHQALITRLRDHLIHAWCLRIAAAQQHCGDRFGLAILRRDPTVAITASTWPAGGVPFNRVFDYQAPQTGLDDPLLTAAADAVVEVMPGLHQEQAITVLRAAGYGPAWMIPWLIQPLTNPIQPMETTLIEQLSPTDLAVFADTWVAGYGVADEFDSHHAFAQFGFTAPGFACFLARVDNQPAAVGVVHLHGESALIDGATTLPAYRGRGLQKALLAARLAYAQRQGATVAFSRTGAGSVSEANLQTLGFRQLVASVAWRLESR